MKEIIGRGAEALLYREGDVLVKERIVKSYRLPALDEDLRKSRTRREGKLLHKLEGVVPKVYEVDDECMQIRMTYVEGTLVRDSLDQKSSVDQEILMREIGRIVGVFHSKDIIHGDLTTSNIIESEGKVFFIDFGLGFVSLKVEDKAVDLHVFRQALDSKHYVHAEQCYRWFLDGYRQWQGSEEVLQRLEKVEQRGRYKRKFVSSTRKI